MSEAEAKDAEQIRDEIEATRENLGETVEALAAKTDVKGQAKQKVEETKRDLSEDPRPLVYAGAAAVAVVALVLWRRRRS